MSKEIVEAIESKDSATLAELVNEALLGLVSERLDEKRAEMTKNLFNEGKMKMKEQDDEDMDDEDEEEMEDDEEEKDEMKEEEEIDGGDGGQSKTSAGGTTKQEPPKAKGDAKKGKKIKSDHDDESEIEA